MAFECWQTIKYSNIFEYYSFENAKTELIEGNLDNLKAATCELIRLIQEICVENIKDTHADLVTEIRLHILLFPHGDKANIFISNFFLTIK